MLFMIITPSYRRNLISRSREVSQRLSAIGAAAEAAAGSTAAAGLAVAGSAAAGYIAELTVSVIPASAFFSYRAGRRQPRRTSKHTLLAVLSMTGAFATMSMATLVSSTGVPVTSTGIFPPIATERTPTAGAQSSKVCHRVTLFVNDGVQESAPSYRVLTEQESDGERFAVFAKLPGRRDLALTAARN